jgi:hypothetical protein
VNTLNRDIRPRLKHFTRPLIAAACVALCAGAAFAAPAPSLEYPIKATFLEKFGDFVTWPAEASPSPAFNICVLGEDPFGAMIDQTLRGQMMGGRPIALMRPRTAEDAHGCHIVYVGKSEQTAAVLAALAGRPILTVTDATSWNGAPRGIIHFVIADNRVRFVIDDATAAQGGLVISSKLLGVAMAVNSRPRTP